MAVKVGWLVKEESGGSSKGRVVRVGGSTGTGSKLPALLPAAGFAMPKLLPLSVRATCWSSGGVVGAALVAGGRGDGDWTTPRLHLGRPV